MYGNGYQGYYSPGGYYGAAPDQLSQLRMGQAQQPVQQPMQPQQQQSSSGLLWVQGEAGAKSYLVANGSSVLLMDSERQCFYIKSCDASGMPSMRVFDYQERKPAQVPAEQPAQAEYVTREDFNALVSRVDEMSKRPARSKMVKEAVTDEPTV